MFKAHLLRKNVERAVDMMAHPCYSNRLKDLGNRMEAAMKTRIFLSLNTLLLGSLAVPAANTPSDNPYTQEFAKLAWPELPNRAAEQVKRADAASRQATTLLVVKAAVATSPASAPAVTAAIARAVPDMAPAAARTAAAEQPSQAAAIAGATSVSAPSQASNIVTAICSVTPTRYRDVAVAAAQGAPDRGREILEAVAVAQPELKPGLDPVLAAQPAKIKSVADTLDHAIALLDDEGKGHGKGPPFEPPGPPPTKPPPGVPPGHGHYGRP